MKITFIDEFILYEVQMKHSCGNKLILISYSNHPGYQGKRVLPYQLHS